MTTMADLPKDLVEEIFSRVPMTSLRPIRLTCKKWNALSKSHVFCKKAVARKHFLGFLLKDSRVCTMKFDLEDIRNNDGNFLDPSIKQVSKLNQNMVTQIFHCNGLLLCAFEDYWRLLVWNPYLGETNWIEPGIRFKNTDTYALGYDNDHNYKILRIFKVYQSRTKLEYGFEIYDFSSNSWKVLHVTPDWMIREPERGVSLKGNTYFTAQKIRIKPRRDIKKRRKYLLCFDFTTERFTKPMPFYTNDKRTFVSVSCVGEEQLAVLYQYWDSYKTIEICVTDKIDPIAVSWREFLKQDTGFMVLYRSGSFFIDEEKKVAVIFHEDEMEQSAHIVGKDGYSRSVIIGKSRRIGGYRYPPVCSSYVPSLVQLQINQPDKR